MNTLYFSVLVISYIMIIAIMSVLGNTMSSQPVISPLSTDFSEIRCVTRYLYVFTSVKISDQSVMWFLTCDL